MDVHHIRYFLAVCETMNFTRAATRCNVAQPALSRLAHYRELIELALSTHAVADVERARAEALAQVGEIAFERGRRDVHAIEHLVKAQALLVTQQVGQPQQPLRSSHVVRVA